MNIDNVVLVRAGGNLPLNGELIPSCEGFKLELEKRGDFYYSMRRIIEMELANRLGRPLDLYAGSPDDVLLDKMMEEYRVLTGATYNSTLSFSLNGLVPDDNTCKFSEQLLAVVDPIKNHTEADFLNIEAIDSTIKGRLKVSPDGILVINRAFFESLNEEVQNNLISNFKQVKTFEGSLKEAVHNTLVENNYPSLPLVQHIEKQNIQECPERESMIEFEDKFAEAVGASRLSQQSIRRLVTFYNEADKAANAVLIGDFNKSLQIEEHYKNQFYSFMLAKAESLGIEVSDDEKYYLFAKGDRAEEAMERITKELINAYGGLENFKSFVQEYNEYAMANYLTNDQIIALQGESRK